MRVPWLTLVPEITPVRVSWLTLAPESRDGHTRGAEALTTVAESQVFRVLVLFRRSRVSVRLGTNVAQVGII